MASTLFLLALGAGVGSLVLALATVLGLVSDAAASDAQRADEARQRNASTPDRSDRYDHHDHHDADLTFGGCGDTSCPTGDAPGEVGGLPRPVRPAA